jgi:hypothetical protein
MNATITKKRQLLKRVRRLTEGGLRFRWGEPANCGDEQVLVSLNRVWEKNGQSRYLGGVFVAHARRGLVHGLPWIVRSVGGEIKADGRTNRLGCFRLQDLGDGDYTLEVGADVLTVVEKVKPGKLKKLMPKGDEMLAAEEGTLRFHSANGAIVATVRETRDDELLLETQVDLQRAGLITSLPATEHVDEGMPIVVRFEIFGEQQPTVGELQPQVLGYVGLFKDQDSAVGEISLIRLQQYITYSENCSLRIKLAAVSPPRENRSRRAWRSCLLPLFSSGEITRLRHADLQDLERSRDASEGRSRQALDLVVQQVKLVEE